MNRLRIPLLILLLAAGLAPGDPCTPRALASDSAEEAAAEAAAKAAEEAAEAAAQAAEQAAEEAAQQAEQAAEEAAEEAEQAAEQAAQEAAEQAESAAEEAAQDAAEQAESAAEEAAQDAAEQAESAAEEAAQDTAEQAESAAEEAAQEAAEQAEGAAEDAASAAEDEAEGAAEEAEDAAQDVADDLEGVNEDRQEAEEERDQDAGDDVDDGDDGESDAGDDHNGPGNEGDTATSPERGNGREARQAAESERTVAAVEAFAGGVDTAGNDIVLGEWLVIATAAEVRALERLGYLTRSRQTLQGLDRVVARMEAPPRFDLEAAQAAIQRAAPGAEADFNHLYRAVSAPGPAPEAAGEVAQTLYPHLVGHSGAGMRIGVIDTAVDLQHAAFAGARLQSQDFVSYAGERPQGHGTAIASILVGQAERHSGLLPRAELYLASVFFLSEQGGTTATTLSLVRALDWMAQNRVPVVNMSLAGPPNDILQSAIARSRELGMVVVAAVGNRGPAAAPLYPAAYPDVVAVTAVDAKQQVYRLANRGGQVDFAAPGVGVRHAAAGGGYASSSGTSIAAPFVAAVISASCASAAPGEACLQRLRAAALDIGAPGFDPLFGYGLIRPLRS